MYSLIIGDGHMVDHILVGSVVDRRLVVVSVLSDFGESSTSPWSR